MDRSHVPPRRFDERRKRRERRCDKSDSGIDKRFAEDVAELAVEFEAGPAGKSETAQRKRPAGLEEGQRRAGRRA